MIQLKAPLAVAAAVLAAGISPAHSALGLEARYDLGRRAARFDLPRRLREVSGLTFTRDGRLLAYRRLASEGGG